MRGPPWVMTAALVLIAWTLLAAFIIHDTPMLAQKARVTPAPYYWHWLDDIDPREDTAHYISTGG